MARSAAADVTLVEKDGWTVYINGRVQTFLNYNQGDGHPRAVPDGNGNTVTLLGGGQEPSDAPVELPSMPSATDPGEVQDLRIRTGFVGNVLGFGIRKQIDDATDVLAYTAVTVYIDSTNRRKYLAVQPDWRESYMRITGQWGSLTAGRTLTLFSRGATEITYLYGFKYGLGWPGSVSSLSGSGPGAGHVGFGVLGNGFGAGIAYATPSLGGAQLTVGIYDANNIPGSGTLERTRWPRGEGELTYEMKFGGGMFKLFGNGAWQKIYEAEGSRDQTISGVGYGGRVEVGPVKLGLAGHYGTGIGLDFALQPHPSGFHPDDRTFRTMDGYYAQLMVSPTTVFDISAGAGVTRVKRLDQDITDTGDDDMNPMTPANDDDAVPGVPDSVGHIPIRRQLGISGGFTIHATDYIHVTAEYFRAMFQWHLPSPSQAGQANPEQNFDVINAGITYDW